MGAEGIAPVTDPLIPMNKAKALDPETQKLTAFLASAHAMMGDRRWRVAELIAKANAAPLTGNDGQALHDALVQIAGDGIGRINVRILGSWLTKQTDRRCNGLRVERAGILDGNNRWRIVVE
jgi:hypothetical protein